MNFTGINDQAWPDHLLHVGPVTDEDRDTERGRARLYVRRHAKDMDDQQIILERLGLLRRLVHRDDGYEYEDVEP